MREEIKGINEWEVAHWRLLDAIDAYDDAREYGYPTREAATMGEAQRNFEAVCTKFPAAAAWGKAYSWSMARNCAKAAAGRRAMERIEAGESYEAVIAEMTKEWDEAAEKAVRNV